MLSVRAAGPFTEARRVVSGERQRSNRGARVLRIGKDARMRDIARDGWRIWKDIIFDKLRNLFVRVST